MNLFGGAIQVVLQRPQSGGQGCECFGNVPSPNPALIVVLACGGAQARADATRLGYSLSRALRTMSNDPAPLSAPCGALRADAVGCHAHREPSCRRILIPVGDGTVPLDDPVAGQPRAIDHWVQQIQSGRANFTVLPAFSQGQQPKAPWLLGSLLVPYNACFWRSDSGELTPLVLQAAGITATDFRTFISYRRSDGQTVADQLFDELNRRNFDVFLDRFRMDPGAHVQERIVEELAQKSMVVLVETQDLPQSPWVALEIAYARAYRLGILAVNLDRAPATPGIRERRRIRVKSVAPDGVLAGPDLDRVCRRVEIVHGAAMVRRRNYLRQALRDALLHEGANRQAMGLDGFLEAYPKGGGSQNPYRVWLTPRPADLGDLQTAKVKGGRQPVVVSPGARSAGMRSAAMRWVAGVAVVRYMDESDVPSLASNIAGGTL